MTHSRTSTSRNWGSLPESLENMHYDFWHYRHSIRNTTSSKELRIFLHAIIMYAIHPQAPKNLKENLKSLKDKIHLMNMRDYTRVEFCKDLDKMVEDLTDAIHKENPAWVIPDNYIV